MDAFSQAILSSDIFQGLVETPYHSPQDWLWELDDIVWHLAKRLPEYASRKRRKKTTLLQLPLLEEPEAPRA